MKEVYETVDLRKLKEGVVTEGAYTQFGALVKMWMRNLMGGKSFSTMARYRLTGSKVDISSFINVMGNQKTFIKSAARFGLSDPKTYMNKFKLKSAISRFERQTGIQWPFKG